MKEVTRRSRMKAERRQQLIRAASRLFAERGFRAVSMEDLAAEAGVSGPAVYRHFASKEALLADLLIDVSQQLLEQGSQRAKAASPIESLKLLIAFHTDFALRDRDLIRIQDHDFANLALEDARTVSRLQRAYLDVWVHVLRQINPSLTESVARTKIQAIFGLLNSTPHSASNRDTETTRSILEGMAMDSLGFPLSHAQLHSTGS
jgi:AcrR family transcriptional regulator